MFSKIFTEILKPLSINVPIALINATPPGVKSNTFALSNSEFLYKKVSVNNTLVNLVESNSPHTAFLVRNTCSRSNVPCANEDNFFIDFLSNHKLYQVFLSASQLEFLFLNVIHHPVLTLIWVGFLGVRFRPTVPPSLSPTVNLVKLVTTVLQFLNLVRK